MPPHEKPEVVGAIMVLDHVGYSRQEISNILKERNINVTKSGVHHTIVRKKLEFSVEKKAVKRLTNPETPKVRKRALIAKVKNGVKGGNPKTQRQLARKLKISQTTIHRIFGGSPAKKATSARPFG